MATKVFNIDDAATRSKVKVSPSNGSINVSETSDQIITIVVSKTAASTEEPIDDTSDPNGVWLPNTSLIQGAAPTVFTDNEDTILDNPITPTESRFSFGLWDNPGLAGNWQWETNLEFYLENPRYSNSPVGQVSVGGYPANLQNAVFYHDIKKILVPSTPEHFIFDLRVNLPPNGSTTSKLSNSRDYVFIFGDTHEAEFWEFITEAPE